MHSSRHGLATLLAFLTVMAQVSMAIAQEPTNQSKTAVSPAAPAKPSAIRAYPRYSYYTTEAEATIVCEIALPEQELTQAKLVAKNAAGKTLAEVKDLRPRTMLSLPAKEIPVGQYPVTLSLQRKTGEVIAQQTATLVKRLPKPGCEWKMDMVDKVILNNGKPFFPFGIMIGARTTMEEEVMLKDIADMGFNTVVPFLSDPYEKIEDVLTMGKKYNFYVAAYPGTWRYKAAPGEEPEPQLPKDTAWSYDFFARVSWDWLMNHVYLPGAKKLMNHPNLMAWYLFDEPQDNRDLAACILRLNTKLYELDGYHPTEVLYIPPVPKGPEFSRNCDIIGTDIYWIPGGGQGATDNPMCMTRYTWDTRRHADRELKLAWITPCAEQYSVTRMRFFTEKEQRVQTYLALINGAKCLLYFVYPFKHQATADTFKRLGQEMKILGPACVAPDVAQTVRYTPTAFEPEKNSFPDVQVSLRKNPEGGYILLAANWKRYPVDFACKLSLLGKSGRIHQLFNKKATVKVDQGGFTDTLEPMDTRAYVIEGSAELTMPVEIAVDLKAYPDKADPFYMAAGIPESGAPGKKNLLRNSSFEECSIPGMPDYVKDVRTPKTGMGYRRGDPRGDCGWSVDTTQPYDGKACLRLRDNKGAYTFLLYGVGPAIKEPTPFVFSTWARSESDTNTFLLFYGPGTAQKRYPLTTQWQRLSQVVTVDPKLPWGGHYFGFYTGATSTNNVWLDAMQFEKGTNVTAYER